ncbi:MAG: Flp pilus assembly complex ATPase component TadA [Candidatus Omnitrophica bacterium]|nr:Flp pilus assembly complex ATPase component TadA [Candidatus Omnitrophota bacterium]
MKPMVKIGEILLSKSLITKPQLEQAITESRRVKELIGKTLVRLKITKPQLEQAITESRRVKELIGKTLVRLKFITREQLLESLAEQFSVPFLSNLGDVPVPERVLKAVPAKFVWHYKFMPLALTDKTLRIAVSDPLATWVTEDLKLNLGYDIERVLATEQEILAAIRRSYGVGSETVERIMTREAVAGEGVREAHVEEIEDIERAADDASVIKLVNQLLSEAIASRASDIHIEPYRERVRVRYRIDGLLYEMRVPEEMRHLHLAIVSRIKIMSKLNVVERRLPQDGRAIVKIQNTQVDLRISIIPGLYGENVVIRILPVQLLLSLSDLGLLPDDLRLIEGLMRRPHGIVFLTGPTGSGKTTTLYACLSVLNQESVKIVTIEDPVEYELAGVMQFQVKPEIGLTFASALRSILRHDPDIVMVGEVRDLETAELAIRTSLTGHLIFATLHTNDAASGATRLLDIGIEPYLVASSVNAFISQRLVRVICPSCKVERHDTDQLPEAFRGRAVFVGKGCEACQSIGYRGRTAIHEVLPVTTPIQEMILKKASAAQIKEKAKPLGFRTLFAAGLEKVQLGITTPEEVLRVTDPDERSR